MENITYIEWCIAFSAMLVTFLKNIDAARSVDNKFSLKSYIKTKWVGMLATIILLPVILLVCTDTTMKDILPINKVTAFLAGLQVDSTCDFIVEMAKTKYNKKNA